MHTQMLYCVDIVTHKIPSETPLSSPTQEILVCKSKQNRDKSKFKVKSKLGNLRDFKCILIPPNGPSHEKAMLGF